MKRTLITLTIIFVLLLLSSFYTPFCNFYADYIYGFINLAIGSVTALIPFALGEIIMYAGAVALLSVPVLPIIYIFIKKEGYRLFVKKYLSSLLTVILIFLIIYCTNWLIPFRADPLKVTDSEDTSFTKEEILTLRNSLVDKINALSIEVERDSSGHLIYDYSNDQLFNGMRSVSNEYPRLKGHYSPCKTALCSNFLEWMGIGGYNYIYTMEPTINRYMDAMYTPVIIAHELSHHKGYYKENEAEFLSYIGLIHSESLFLQYCAYVDMFYWIDNAYFQTTESLEEYLAAPTCNEQVYVDIFTARDEIDKFYQENINTVLEDSFSEVSGEVATEGWNIQADILQENCYDGVTLMLLQYYLR